MKRAFRGLALAASLALVAFAAAPVYAGEVGEPAPELTPSKWLNHKGPINWQMLQGKLIVIEKWATW
ncbi:MAG: hypothetical protein ACYS22_09685 [Planctomycetota bacterium]